MDSEIRISELKDEIKKFCEIREWDQFHNPKDLGIGLILEAAELLEHFRYKSLEEIKTQFSDKVKLDKIRHELADVLFFVLRFSQMYDIDLSQALREKMQLNGRKYPVEKSRGSNKKYDEL